MKFFPSIFLYSCIISADVYANELKSGFVYLSDVDPSISIDLKYHSDENFTGKRVRGCNTGRAVLTLKAANALRSVQEDLLTYGYSLVVYDAYRPKKSSDEFNDWLQNEEPKGTKDLYYPNIKKENIKSKGCIKEKYAHIRGSTVDVTIISSKGKLKSPGQKEKRAYQDQKDIIVVNDGSLDMGTSYDLFDPLSEFNNQNISEVARKNRELLREAMQNRGFVPSSKFWWQFTLVREPYMDSQFDFDV